MKVNKAAAILGKISRSKMTPKQLSKHGKMMNKIRWSKQKEEKNETEAKSP